MEVVIGKMAGFCPGVASAVRRAGEALENNKIVYCLGELVHNKQVVESLESKGMITVESLDEVPGGATVIFRAHGEAKKVYDLAKSKNIDVIDLTCGKVLAIHKKVEKESEDSFIIILGKKSHPEVIGTAGFAGKNYYVVTSEDDILDAYMEYEKTDIGRVYVVAQTTISSSYFDSLAQEIEKEFIEAEVIIDKTVCDATEIRQKETKEMAKNFSSMIIIGGKNSSNTKELVKIAEEACQNVFAIETVNEIKDIDFSGINSVGIMAGASTPKDSIIDVKEYLESI